MLVIEESNVYSPTSETWDTSGNRTRTKTPKTVVFVTNEQAKTACRPLRVSRASPLSKRSGSSLSVLPAFINELEAVAVRIEHVRCMVARVVMEPCAGRAIVRGARSDRRAIGLIDLAR